MDTENFELLSIGSHISDLSQDCLFYVETVLLAFIRQCIGPNQCLYLNQALFNTYSWISRSYKIKVYMYNLGTFRVAMFALQMTALHGEFNS